MYAHFRMADIKDKICPGCGRVSPVSAQRCVCGHQFQTQFTQAYQPPQQPYVGYPPQQQYVDPRTVFITDGRTGREGYAVAGMVCGIVGVVAFCAWMISIPCSIVGLVLSIAGLDSKNRGMAIAGAVCSIIALGLTALMVLVFAGAMASAPHPVR